MSRKYKLYRIMAIPLLAGVLTSCGLVEQVKGYFARLSQKRNPDETLVNYTDALQSKNFRGDTSEYTPEDRKNYDSRQEYWDIKQKQEEEAIINEMKTNEQKTKKTKKLK